MNEIKTLLTNLTTQITTFQTSSENYTSEITKFIPTEISTLVTLQSLNDELEKIEKTFEKCNQQIEHKEYIKTVTISLQKILNEVNEKCTSFISTLDTEKNEIENEQREMAKVYDILNEHRTNVKIVEEKGKLKEKKETIQNSFSEEIKQIEIMSESTFDDILFDSEICDWREETSTFDTHLLNKSNVAIVIQDGKENIFGVFVEQNIDCYKYRENGQWKGSSVCDKNAFLFNLKSNGRLEKPMKFNIKENESINAFTLFKQSWGRLFMVGKNDISIMKQDQKNTCTCQQNVFDYQGIENAMNGQPRWNPFCVKRIVVFQMKDNEEQMKKREEKKKVEEENEMKKFEEETNKLNEKSKEIGKVYENEIKQIETWTKMTMKSLLFDSDICDWKKNSSTFDKRVFGKEHVVIMIKTTKGIVFGGVVQKQINSYKKVNEEGYIEGIVDPQSFVFSFNKGIPIRYLMKQSKKKEPTFILYNKYDNKLCVFGECDIWIPKQGKNAACIQNEHSFYEYQGKENALVGVSGTNEKSRFEIKHLIAFELSQLYKKAGVSSVFKTTSHNATLNQNVSSTSPSLKASVLKTQQTSNGIIPKAVSLKGSGRAKMKAIDNHRKGVSKELETIEKWTNLFYKETLFDSEKDNWKKGISVFDTKLMKKENLVFYVETFEGTILGGFLKKKINATMRKTADADAFIFSNVSKTLVKYDVKKEHKYDSFILCSAQDKMLFSFGNDLFIAKEDSNGESYVNERNGYYNYGSSKNVMIGKIGKFVVKKIMVYQLG